MKKLNKEKYEKEIEEWKNIASSLKSACQKYVDESNELFDKNEELQKKNEELEEDNNRLNDVRIELNKTIKYLTNRLKRL